MKLTLHWRRSVTLFLILTTIFLLSGLVAVAQDEKILVVGHAESTDSYDPARGYTQTTGVVERAVYETLVTFPDKDVSSIQPMLADSWDISSDGLTYVFKLHAGAVFSSGNPVTADDVVFSFNRLENVKGSPSFQADRIASTTATDPETVTIVLKAPSPEFLSLLCAGFFSVTDSKMVQANGGIDAADAKDTDKAGDYLDQNSAGSGPYVLQRWEKQSRTVLVRNPNYTGNRPGYFDQVIINNIPVAADQKAALEAGDINIALDMTQDQTNALKDNPDLAVVSTPSNYTHFLLMNEDKTISGPMSDPKVQLAVRYALDYEGYKALWGGITPGSNLAVGVAGAYGEDKAFKRDVAKAKQLLSDAGYPNGFETTLSYPDFTFQGVNMNTNAQKIQSDLAEVNITVKLDVGDLQTKLAEYRAGTDAFFYMFWGPDFEDPADFFSFLPGGNVATTRANWKPESLTSDITDILAQAKVEVDPAKRIDLFGKLQDYNQQNGPFAPFNQPAVPTAFQANLQGYVWHPQWLIDVALLSQSS